MGIYFNHCLKEYFFYIITKFHNVTFIRSNSIKIQTFILFFLNNTKFKIFYLNGLLRKLNASSVYCFLQNIIIEIIIFPMILKTSINTLVIFFFENLKLDLLFRNESFSISLEWLKILEGNFA